MQLGSEILSCDVLPSGSIAVGVGGCSGNASIIPAPRAAAGLLEKHGAAQNRDALAAGSLMLRAAAICETIRAEVVAAEPNGKVFRDATNFDTCMKFLTCYKNWTDVAEKNANFSIAFHGTAGNVPLIIDKSLCVADGVALPIRNGQSFGNGIYVSTEPELAFTYSKQIPIFACLVFTGTLKKALCATTSPNEAGCDAFHGSISGTEIFVLQSSSQVLPCLTIDSNSVNEAVRLLEKLVVLVEQNS